MNKSQKKRKNYDEFGATSEAFGGISRGPQRKRGDDTYSSEDLFNRILKDEKAGKLTMYEKRPFLNQTKEN